MAGLASLMVGRRHRCGRDVPQRRRERRQHGRRHQGVHRRLPVAGGGDRPPEEGPAAPEEDAGAQQQGEELAGPARPQRRRRDDRQRQEPGASGPEDPFAGALFLPAQDLGQGVVGDRGGFVSERGDGADEGVAPGDGGIERKRARDVAKLTPASTTPTCFRRARSTLAAQAPQDMPPTVISTLARSAPASRRDSTAVDGVMAG